MSQDTVQPQSHLPVSTNAFHSAALVSEKPTVAKFRREAMNEVGSDCQQDLSVQSSVRNNLDHLPTGDSGTEISFKNKLRVCLRYFRTTVRIIHSKYLIIFPKIRKLPPPHRTIRAELDDCHSESGKPESRVFSGTFNSWNGHHHIRFAVSRIWSAVSTTLFRSTLASVLLLGFFTVPPAALAQTVSKFVSNTGQSDNFNLSLAGDRAQRFTTGSHSVGYGLTRIDIEIVSISGGQPTYTAEIWQNNALYATLSNPASLRTGINSFHANGAITLNSNANYVFVLNLASANNSTRLGYTQSDDEDSGGATGWSIRNTSLTRNADDSTNWIDHPHSMQIAIHGFTLSTTKMDPVVSIDPSGPIEVLAVNADLQLTASAYDPDGGFITFAWTAHKLDPETFERGEVVTDDVLTNALTLTPTFNSDTWGWFDITLRVTDNELKAVTKELTVAVRSPESSDSTLSSLVLADVDGNEVTLTPAFSPGRASYIAELSHATAELDVTATSNSDIAVFNTFAMELPDGSVELINDAVSGTASRFTGINAGNNTLQLVVSSADGTSANDYHVVVARPAQDPVASISPGTNQTIAVSTNLSLTGSGSDPDGGDVRFEWRVTDSNGNTVADVLTVNSSDPTRATFNSDSWGRFTVRLTVTDDENVTATSEVLVTAQSTESRDATLSSLVLADVDGTALVLTPAFSSTTGSYSTVLNHATEDIDVTATLNRNIAVLSAISQERGDDTSQSVTNPTSGTAGRLTGLTFGDNIVTVEVNSADASASMDYSVTVTRKSSPVATILTSAPSSIVTGQSLELTGSGEDPDGGTVTYAWTASDGTNSVTGSVLTNASTATPTFRASTSGTYTVTLTVTDDESIADTDIVTVTVTDNQLPTASISPSGSQTIFTGTGLMLTGSGSSDPDGGPLTYQWTATNAANTDVSGSVLTGADTAAATFSATLSSGTSSETYTVTLTVTDSGGGTDMATVSVTVADTVPPIVSVSPSGTARVPTGINLTLTSSASDPDGGAVTYAWTASEGTNTVTNTVLSSTNTAATTFNAADDGTYTVTLTVTDDESETTSSTVTVTVVQQSLIISSTMLSVDEAGGTGSWTVRLNTQPTATVTVSIASDDQMVARVFPSNLTFTAADWSTPKTVRVTGQNDDIDNAADRTAMITHTASGADYASAPVEVVTVTATDDDEPGLSVSRTTLTVGENGGSSTWTVRLSSEPTDTVTVNIANSDPTVAVTDQMSLTFTVDNWNRQQTVMVTGQNDDIDTADRMAVFTHTVSGAAEYVSFTATVTVTANDDDVRGLTIDRTELTVQEGRSKGYTVKLTSKPTASVTVTPTAGTSTSSERPATVSTADSSNTLTFTTENWNVAQEVSLMVANDDTPEADSSVQVTNTASGGDYGSVAQTVNVSVPGYSLVGTAVIFVVPADGMLNVPDDPSLPGAGTQLKFDQTGAPNVILRPPVLPEEKPRGFQDNGVAVDIAFVDDSQPTAEVKICLPRKDGGRVFIWDELESDWIELPLPDDEIPDDYACGVTEQFSLFATGSTPPGSAESVEKVRLAQLGRVIAGQVVDAVQDRLEASREAGFEGTMAGQALPSFDANTNFPAYVSTPHDQSSVGSNRDWQHTKTQTLTEQSFLSSTQFSLTDGFTDLSSVSVWGQASITGFEGEGLDDGQVTSGFFGADWASEELTAGLALSHSRGKGTWVSDGEGEKFKSSLTGIHPYFGYDLSNSISVWGVAGYGKGDVETTENGETTSADIDMLMFAGGTGGDLESSVFAEQEVSLSWNTDALWVRMGSEAEDASVSQLRAAVAASKILSTSEQGELKPSFEIGLRLDGGDAETGLGAEVGLGLEWRDPSSGLITKLQGRGLLTHANDYVREQGMKGSFGWDPQPDSAEGPSLSMSYTLGNVSNGADSLFTHDTLSAVEAIGDDVDSHRMEIRWGYGVPVLGGQFIGTPHTALGYSDDERDVSLGWQLTLVDRSAAGGTGSLGLSVEARRSESASDGYRHEDEIIIRLRTQF